MFKKAYDVIMNENVNAFKYLPNYVKFQLMSTLAYMWCGVFSLGIGSFMWFGTSVVFHTLFIAGIFITAELFKRARNHELDHLDHRKAYKNKKDGTAMYDDIWGGI